MKSLKVKIGQNDDLFMADFDSWTSKNNRLLKGTLFASLVLSMAAATKKEKKRRSLPLEGWR